MTAARLQRPARRRQAAGGGFSVLAACAALLVCGAWPAAAVDYYRSDAYGTRLARLDGDPADHHGYALAVDTPNEAQAAGLSARRRLLRAGAVIAEWRRRADGAGDGSVEHELAAGQVVAERRFDAAGRMLEERRFSAAGHLVRRAELIYRGGMLRRIDRYDGAGTLTATEEYDLTSSGRLRRFSHTPVDPSVSDGTAATGSEAGTSVDFLFFRGELIEERRRAGDAEVILRFRGGEPLATEQWQGERLVNEGSAGTRIDHAAATRAETTLDDAGRVESERVYDVAAGEDGDRLVEERRFRYRPDGSVLSLQVIGRAGREAVDYEFAEDGRLVRERVRRRGRLVRVTSHPSPEERVVEVYGEGDTVLRVTWRGDEPMREELLRGGEVVRTRELAPGAAPGTS